MTPIVVRIDPESLAALRGLTSAMHALAGAIEKKGNLIMSTLQDLQAQVAANTAVEASAVALIQGLAAKLDAAGTDPAALAALSSELKTSADALASAITANTPAAPAAPAAPASPST